MLLKMGWREGEGVEGRVREDMEGRGGSGGRGWGGGRGGFGGK